MNLLYPTILWIHYISLSILSAMRVSEIHGSALVCCMNLKRQKDPFLQSLVDKFNNSFAVIMYPPFKRDGVRVRLRWIFDHSVLVGIKAKYLLPVPKIIFHTTPYIQLRNPAVANSFEYLVAKWKDDPINVAARGTFDTGDPPEVRERILNTIREMQLRKHQYCHCWWGENKLNMSSHFHFWINETFAEDSKITRILMKHCVRRIHHDHSTVVTKILRKMRYIEGDVERVQNGFKQFTDIGYPRYDRLHPRLIFHYFQSEQVLLNRGDKLLNKLLYDSHSIILVMALCVTTYYPHFWKLNHTLNHDEFNLIFPGQRSRHAAILQARLLRDVVVGSGCTKSILQDCVTRLFIGARPETIAAAANALRSRVKSKMQKMIALIPNVARKVWSIMAQRERENNLTTSNQKLVTMMASVRIMVGNELKLKIPTDRTESKQYFQFWVDFAKCVADQIKEHQWANVVGPELDEMHRKLPGQKIDGPLLETLLYWKAIDLRLDPSYDVHVIGLAGLRNNSEEQKRTECDILSYAIGCAELVDENLIEWIYYD